MKNPFRFKQFSITQEKSAMKIGTDGVLLGAWAAIKQASTILDIGTGTGLIALMCAQRNPKATITAIEIDQLAAEEARSNFNASPWASRLSIVHTSLQAFVNENKLFDHITCNPPFFEPNEQLDNSRQMARQTTQLTPKDLASAASRLLSVDGQFSLIFPYDRSNELIRIFETERLYPIRKTDVRGRIGIAPKRVLLSFSRTKQALSKNELTIELTQRHEYSKEYIDLTKDFYLKM